MAQLILIRHGETQKNIDKVLHTDKDPEGLNDKGINQIKATATYLQKLKPDVLVTSKEKRAIQSGDILSKSLKLQTETMNGFQERNWGKLSGKPWSEIKSILDPLPLEERYVYVPEGGESWKVFEERLIKSLKEIIKYHPNKNIVVVSHGGAIRALMPYLLGVPREESFKHDPDNASLTIFNIVGPDKFEDVMINSTNYLPEGLKSISK